MEAGTLTDRSKTPWNVVQRTRTSERKKEHWYYYYKL